MAEQLEIQVKAETGEAVANLKKTENAVAGVTNKTKELDATSKKAGESVGQGVSKSVSKFTQLAEGVGKVTMIFGLAVAAGKALAAGIDAISASMDKSARIEGEAIDRKIKFDKALRLAKQGTIDLGHSTEEMLKNYDTYISKMKAAAAGTDEQTAALARQKKEMESIGAAIAKANAGKGFTLMSPEDADAQLNSFRSLATGLEDILGKAFESGGEEERNRWAAANEEAVKKVIEAYQKMGAEVPAHIKAVSDAQNSGAPAATQWAEQQAGAYDRLVEAQRQSRTETDRVAGSMQKWTSATQGAGKAFGGLSGDFTSLNKAAQDWVAEGNDINKLMVGMEIIHLSVAKASDEATAALYRQLEASKLLREEQTLALDAAEGWRDYLANLKEGYDTGITSLGGYMSALIAFKAQLLQLFSSANGEAKKGLEDVIAMIQVLMQTVGSRTPFDTSYRGELDRAFKEGGK